MHFPSIQSLIALALTTVALNAAAENTNTVYALGNSGTVFDTTEIGLPAEAGTPGTINLGTWGGNEAHYAAASGSSLSLRSMVATRGDGNQAETRSSFNWTTTALGAPGVSVGTPTTVTLSFHIDGRTAAGFGAAFVSGPVVIGLPADFTLQSHTAATLRLDVYDLDSPQYEGGAPIARVDYVSAANVESGLYSPSSSYPSGAAYTNVGHQVQLQVNDPKLGDWNWSGNDSSYSSISDAWPSKKVFDVNTGVLSLSFDTLVGNQINLEGSLNASIYCSSYAYTGTAPSCAGLSDFSHTFDAELTSSVPGVTFSDYTPGVFPATAVPEPDAWVLVLAGAAGLLWHRRGQRAAKST